MNAAIEDVGAIPSERPARRQRQRTALRSITRVFGQPKLRRGWLSGRRAKARRVPCAHARGIRDVVVPR